MREATSAVKLDSYADVRCPACLRLHFVKKIAGELLGKQVPSQCLIPAPSSPYIIDDPIYDPMEIDARTEEDEG
jgi:hypothetical protein